MNNDSPVSARLPADKASSLAGGIAEDRLHFDPIGHEHHRSSLSDHRFARIQRDFDELGIVTTDDVVDLVGDTTTARMGRPCTCPLPSFPLQFLLPKMTPGIRPHRGWLFTWSGPVQNRFSDKRHAALLASHLSPSMLGRHTIRFQTGRALNIQHQKSSLQK
jgi:hypothetical protein